MIQKFACSALILVLFLITITPMLIHGQTYIGNFNKINEIASIDERVFFVADDGEHGLELWVTNGRKNSTSLVKDILPGYKGSNPSNLISYKGELYFSAYTEINGAELWKSDGTPEGTQIVKDIKPNTNTYNSGAAPSQLVLFNDKIYFYASDDGNDGDLWQTDGTASGTQKVFETEYVGINDFTVVGGNLFFKKGLKQLYQLKGSTNEVVELKIDDYYFIAELNSFNNSLYFITHTTYRQDIRFYKYNPEEDELILLQEFKQPRYGGLDIDNFTEVDSTIFFSIRTNYINDPETDVLWKTDGTPEGTVPVKSFGWARHWSNSYTQNFISFNKLLFFRASSNANNYLYQSDGTEEGTKLMYAIGVNADIEPVISNDKLYFGSGDAKLWETDGSASGTRKYSDVKLSTYTDPTVLNDEQGILYFKATDEYGLALYNNIPNAEINVKQGYKNIPNGGSLKFNSKVDSISRFSFSIYNTGHKELSLSKVQVTGSDFYLEGEPEQFIQPNESTQFDLIYFPHSEQPSDDQLEVYSNDENEGVFKINILGSSTYGSGTFLKGTIDFSKEIKPAAGVKSIMLDNNTIKENEKISTIVGLLSVPQKDNITFSLAEGEGDRDNQLFSIDGDKLIALESFDYESSNCFNVRVEAITAEGASYQQGFIIDVINLNEDINFDKCEESLNNLSFALHDVAVVNENTLIAIGSEGVILKSENFGDSWYQVNSGTKMHLFNLQFTDDEVGYIVGDYNLILKTENGGNDWFPIRSPNQEYPHPSDLIFINNNTGFVYGGDGKIFATTDGGKSWQLKRLGYNELSGASFLNDNKGFICGRSNTLFKTEDGGREWSIIDMSEFGWNINFVDIQFVNDSIGFIADRNGRIYKSYNGGEKWEKVGGFPTDYTTDIHFLNDSIGYAIAGWSGSGIYKTMDGGATWDLINEINYYQTLTSFDFSPDGLRSCAVGYGSSFGDTGEDGRTILIMKDNDWNLNSGLVATDYQCVSVVNDSTAFIFGTRHFKTTNAGITWHELNVTTGSDIVDSYFINKDTGLIIDGKNIFKTADGGVTWFKIETSSGGYQFLKDIYFFDSNLGFVSGRGSFPNLIYRTIDGGQNWEPIEITVTLSIIEDFHFLDEKNGFAVVGIPSEILKTEDGGFTWKSIKNSPKWLHTINFIDDNNGIVLGHDGYELKTNDGGITWEEIETGIPYDFYSVYFTGNQNGYAICDRAIYSTPDGGLSWTFLSQFDNLKGMGNTDRFHLFVGKRGLLYSIEDNTSPTIPGYIYGQDTVSENTITTYSVPLSASTHYIWSVNGNNPIEYSMNKAKVNWKEAGDYIIEVRPYNSCGVGEIRELHVSVENRPTPEILGADTVKSKSSEMYQLQNSNGSRLQWNVKGAQNYESSNSNLDVEWGEPGRGKIEVLETKIASGARGLAVLDVYILDEPVVNSSFIDRLIENCKVYPNPFMDFIIVDMNSLTQEDITIRITGTNGRVLKTNHFRRYSDIKMDVRDLVSGFYILEIEIANKKQVFKIMKK